MARRSKTQSQQNTLYGDTPNGDGRQDAAPSKTALKRDAEDLRKLGVAISELPASRRKKVDMPDDLREAIEAYVRMTAHGAKKRQMQYVGKLLRGVDAEPLRQAIEDFAAGRAADARRLHDIERWRERMISDDDAVTEWMGLYPETDVQRLRSLIRAARRDRKEESPGSGMSTTATRSFRALFQFLADS